MACLQCPVSALPRRWGGGGGGRSAAAAGAPEQEEAAQEGGGGADGRRCCRCWPLHDCWFVYCLSVGRVSCVGGLGWGFIRCRSMMGDRCRCPCVCFGSACLLLRPGRVVSSRLVQMRRGRVGYSTSHQGGQSSNRTQQVPSAKKNIQRKALLKKQQLQTSWCNFPSR